MRLSARKRPLKFETDDCVFDRGRQRPIVVHATPKFAELSLKGLRTGAKVNVAWSAMYMRGLQIAEGK